MGQVSKRHFQSSREDTIIEPKSQFTNCSDYCYIYVKVQGHRGHRIHRGNADKMRIKVKRCSENSQHLHEAKNIYSCIFITLDLVLPKKVNNYNSY